MWGVGFMADACVSDRGLHRIGVSMCVYVCVCVYGPCGIRVYILAYQGRNTHTHSLSLTHTHTHMHTYIDTFRHIQTHIDLRYARSTVHQLHVHGRPLWLHSLVRLPLYLQSTCSCVCVCVCVFACVCVCVCVCVCGVCVGEMATRA